MNRLNSKRYVTSYYICRLRRRQNVKYFFFVLHVIYEMTSSNDRSENRILNIQKKSEDRIQNDIKLKMLPVC